jgi:PAT family beta-lactamase induction signal transducer AmpG
LIKQMPMVPSSPVEADAAPRRSVAEALSTYLKPRVLVVMFLGFSSGLPLALSGSTLLVWMTEGGVDLRSLGLLALVGTPYTIKFLWAPLVDALDVPFLARRFGRRRGWLLLTQFLLIAAIVFLGSADPSVREFIVVGAVLVAVVSATQDIVVDAFRVESLDESEQAAGMAGYVAAYRIGMLVSTAGALYLVSGFETAFGLDWRAAWRAGYFSMAVLVLIGIATTLVAKEPEKSVTAEAEHARETPLRRLIEAATGAFAEFLSRKSALAVLAFVVLFKFTDALSGALTAPFVIELGFTRTDYATIIKGVGLAATLIGGFAGGFLARAYALPTCLWIGGIAQSLANLAFSWQAVVGHDVAWLTFAIVTENFTSAIGTVIFVAYLSALCRNPLHTATQYALLTALAAFGRTFLSSGAGFVAEAAGWVAFFALCAAAGLPALALLYGLQRSGHFATLLAKPEPPSEPLSQPPSQ